MASRSGKSLPAEFDDLGGVSPDLKNCVYDLKTDSVWRTFGIYRAIVKREHLSQFLLQSRIELRKFLEDEGGNAADPLTVQRIQNFWATLISVENGPTSVRAPLSLLAVMGFLLVATVGTGIWYLLSQRAPTAESAALAIAPAESAAAPVIPKKNVDIEALNAQLNDLNAQFSNLVSQLAQIPETNETLSEESTEAAKTEMGSLEKDWDNDFAKFVSKLKEVHAEISENPIDSFPKNLETFSQTPFSMDARSRILQVSSQLLNHLSLMASTPDVNLDDSENDPSSP
ncbi:MAG: hypothetical protein K2X47_02860 [Bdellovibrionales bacterium]|nr:hypothetical protein [Bdellovibrionales bacterium]